MAQRGVLCPPLGTRTIHAMAKVSEPTRSDRVGDKQRTLRYLAFFEAMADLEDEGPLWHSLSAGLVTLRLVDEWLARGGSEPGAGQWALQAVRQQIECVPVTDPARAILDGIVGEVERPGEAVPSRIAPRLMAYGRSLDFSGRWALAAELFETVLAYIDPVTDSDLAIAAQFRLAFCRRVLGQLDAAEQDYAVAGRMAANVGDTGGTLRSSVGLAKVAMARGNLPVAERMLEDVVQKAAAPELRTLRAQALHDRANVAIWRKEHERGIAMLNEALPDIGSAAARDRVIADIALGFLELGVRSAARDAFMVVAATAEEQFSRWSATINLLHLAAVDEMEPAFEQYRRQLAGEALTPELAASYRLNLGIGFGRFGRTEQAREALAEGIRVAEQHGLNRELFRLEEELSALAKGERRERTPSLAPPASVEPVATTMRKLREEALAVGG
jgi:tetratricopeptide (TPR) repeat protein